MSDYSSLRLHVVVIFSPASLNLLLKKTALSLMFDILVYHNVQIDTSLFYVHGFRQQNQLCVDMALLLLVCKPEVSNMFSVNVD